MAAITQLTPNFLGGVSRQNDDKKLPNQITECVNGYPDPTFGLLKRPGMKYTNVLRKANGDAFTKAELAGASWFFINRSVAGSYIGCIKGSDIFVWTAEDGTFCTITDNAGTYLTDFDAPATAPSFHFRSIQDTTVITNKAVNTAMQAANTFTANSQGTIRLLGVDNSNYTVTIQGVSATFTPQNSTTFNDMLFYTGGGNHSSHMVDAIVKLITDQQAASNADFDGKWYVEGYANSIVIRYTTGANAVITDYSVPTDTPDNFTLTAKGGVANDYLEAFQDEVTNISKLPLESFTGHTVKVVNTDAAEDDYYVRFDAYVDPGGPGYWEETLARNVSPGVDASKMPHALVNTAPTAFTFDVISYTNRLAGDAVTNPDPSFIGSPITSTFFYNNRFGMLSGDNIILGVANDTYNFFAKSALTQINSDPIDLNVSSVRPVILSDVLPSPQGLLLFSERQQFQLYATDASVLTPSSAVIRSLSNYEMDTSIAPVDVGTSTVFASKVPGYSKLFSMQLRDVEQTPIVVDISKAVLGWIPDTVDVLTVSPTNSSVFLVDRDSSYCYLYKYYNNGEEDLFQSWTKWQMPGTIQGAQIINDAVVFVLQYEDEYAIGSLAIDETPDGTVVATAANFNGNPVLDMATRPVKPAIAVDAVVYDSTNDITKIYVPYTPIQDKEAAMLLTIPTADLGTDAVLESDQGYWAVATERTEVGTGFRYFEVKGDFSGYADGIVVGYNYELDVTLPKFYFRNRNQETDYTALLTVSRVKLSVGKSGAITFKVKGEGSNQWRNIQHTVEADRYSSDTNPVTEEKIFTVPIHQRNTNFELKVTSNFPYPVSLVSMMWEGNYSPRFYKRV
jgi:hypothetical protein